MGPEEAARVNKLYQEARFVSQFSFVEGTKSAAQLKSAYETYFTRVWEYAGKTAGCRLILEKSG